MYKYIFVNDIDYGGNSLFSNRFQQSVYKIEFCIFYSFSVFLLRTSYSASVFRKGVKKKKKKTIVLKPTINLRDPTTSRFVNKSSIFLHVVFIQKFDIFSTDARLYKKIFRIDMYS